MDRYEEICAGHEWNVPERYNIAADVCDKHPPDKLAMIFEDHRGTRREVTWGEQQSLANRAANMLAAHGVGEGDRVAVCCPASPETAAVFFGTWKVGGILIAMSVLYGDDGIEHRVRTAGVSVIVTDHENAARMPAGLVDHVIELDAELLAGYDDSFETLDTLADDPAEIFFTSGTTGLAKGILHAHRYILGHEEFEYCHEIEDCEIFHGMGEWAWAAGICPLIGAWRLGAVQYVYARKGGFDPGIQLEALSRNKVSNVFTTPTAMRAMMSIEDAGEKYPQVFRRVCSAGEPLNPEAIKWFREQYGVTVLDYYGLSESYPLVGNFPFMEVREGSMGKPMPGWQVEILDQDENPVAPGEKGEICLRAGTNPHYPLRYWENPEATARDFEGEWFHTADAAYADDDGYFWFDGRADDVIISAGYRIGPFEVESACIEHPAVHEAAAVAAPDPTGVKGEIVKAFIVLNEGFEPSDELSADIRSSVRGSLSAYAYPREIEFVADLPKTLTGKIRRIELREHPG
jgi:acetyl-CoA synthetase